MVHSPHVLLSILMFLHHATYMIYTVLLNAHNTTQRLFTDSFMNFLNHDTTFTSHCDVVFPFPCSHASCQPLLNISVGGGLM